MTEWRNVICPVLEDIITAVPVDAVEWAVPVPEAACTEVPVITAVLVPAWVPATAASVACPMVSVELLLLPW